MKRLLFVFLFFSCTETKTIMAPGEIVVKNDSSAVSYQILNTSYPDDLLSTSVIGDTIYGFSTARVFNFNGEAAINVAAVRSVAVWRSVGGEDILIGTTRGQFQIWVLLLRMSL